MPSLVLIITGVAGSGKTTVGRMLAGSLGWRFTDADDLHPPDNIAKLSAGIPLTDADRAPWLAALRTRIDAQLAAGVPTVLACSALKESYRAQLAADPGRVKFIHLHGTREQLAARLGARSGHFASPDLLDSQLATLEKPREGLALDIAVPPAVLAADIRLHFGL